MRLYLPGERITRKGGREYPNKYCIAKGQVCGREYEITCLDDGGAKTTDPKAAARFIKRFIEKVETAPPAARHPETFREAVDVFRRIRSVGRNDERYLDKLNDCWIEHRDTTFGALRLAEISNADIGAAATALYPRGQNETRNRQAYAPAATILHFAHDNGWCPYLVVKKLKQKKPRTRRPAPGAVDTLIAKTTGAEQLVLKFLKYQGWRITETLSVRWDRVDLVNSRFELWISKAGAWKYVPMHPEIRAALIAVPKKQRTGKLFPWTWRSGVYKWLRPLCRKLDIEFTPHMARHEWGSDRGGFTDRDLMGANTWTNEKSVKRYVDSDENRARDVLEYVPPTPKRRGKIVKLR